MIQKTKVIAGFPGVGKSTFFRRNMGEMKVSDSDSSQFSWIHDENGVKTRNPDFPLNYIRHIQTMIINGYDIIFVSTHKEVIDALKENFIEFTIVYPSCLLKDTYINRYEVRGSDEAFIKLLSSKWDSFIDDIESVEGVDKVKLVAHNEGINTVFADWHYNNEGGN